MTEQAYVYDGPNVLFVFTTRNGVTTSRRWMNAYGLDKRYGFEDYASADPVPGTGVRYEVHADYLGNIVAVVDPVTGAIVSRYGYDSFGQRSVVAEAVDPGYGFTGQQYDAETGLQYHRARYYDPAEGRFLSTDPLGFPDGPRNAYVYVANTPYQKIDPTGLSGSSAWGQLTLDSSINANERTPLIHGAATSLLLRAFNLALDEVFMPMLAGFPGVDGNFGLVEDPSRSSSCSLIDRPARGILDIDTRTHGGAAHDAAIKRRHAFLVFLNIKKYKSPVYNDITMNQNQKNAGGRAVSTCWPDLQYDYFVAHYLEEYMYSSDTLQTFNKMLVMNRADPYAAQVMFRVPGLRR